MYFIFLYVAYRLQIFSNIIQYNVDCAIQICFQNFFLKEIKSFLFFYVLINFHIFYHYVVSILNFCVLYVMTRFKCIFYVNY